MPATRGESYQLSKITNDSARGERGNVMLDVSKCGRESRQDRQPWPLVPPPCMRSHCDHYHGYHSLHAHCTQSVCHVSYSLCLPSASLTVPAMPVVLSVVFMRTLSNILRATKPPHHHHSCCVLISGPSTIPAMFCPLAIPIHLLSILIGLNQTWPACSTKAAALNTLTVPIVRALWYTCTGNIPAGSADRGHVSARRSNRRD